MNDLCWEKTSPRCGLLAAAGAGFYGLQEFSRSGSTK